MSLHKRHLPAYYRAQARVADLLKPYLGRNFEQYYSANGQSDAAGVREVTRLYRETWMLPILDEVQRRFLKGSFS